MLSLVSDLFTILGFETSSCSDSEPIERFQFRMEIFCEGSGSNSRLVSNSVPIMVSKPFNLQGEIDD